MSYTCAAVLVEERVALVGTMLQSCETWGPKGFETTLATVNRLLAKSFATSHAVNYIRHCCKLAKHLETSSDSSYKRLLAMFCTYKMTANRTWRLFDRHQEDRAKDFRSVLTKKLQRGQGHKVEMAQAAICSNKTKRGVDGVAGMRGNKPQQRKRDDATKEEEKLFVLTAITASLKLNLDADGPPKINEPGASNELVACDEKKLLLLNSENGNARLLDWSNISDKSVRDHFFEWHIKHPRSSKVRSEKPAPIPLLMPSAKKRKEAYEKAIKRRPPSTKKT